MSKRGDISNKETSFDRAYLEKLLADKQAEESLSSASRNIDPEADPFLAEALDGLTESSSAEINKALADLDDSIASRTGYRIGSRKGFAFNSPYFMVAASALILAVAAIFIFRPSLPTNTTLSELQDKKETVDENAKESAPVISELSEITESDIATSQLESEIPATPGEELIEEVEDALLVEADEEAAIKDGMSEFYAKDASSSGEIGNEELEVATDAIDSEPDVSKENLSKNEIGNANDDAGYISSEGKAIQNVRADDLQSIPQTNAQTTRSVEIASKKKVSSGSYGAQQAAASYPGGMSALQSYLVKNTKYPKKIDNPVSGKVLVSFVVDEKGRVKDAKVLQSIHPTLDKEALRIVKNMPKWSPAMSDGKSISSSHNVHVVFQR